MSASRRANSLKKQLARKAPDADLIEFFLSHDQVIEKHPMVFFAVGMGASKVRPYARPSISPMNRLRQLRVGWQLRPGEADVQMSVQRRV
jgi:hypothetical protein